MKAVLLLAVVALVCAQAFAGPFRGQINVVDNNYPNNPSQVHVVDNNYNDPSQVHVVDNNYNDQTQVHVVDNNPYGHHQGNGQFVEDQGFYRPTVNGNNPGQGGFVEDQGFYRPTVNDNNQGGFVVDEAFGRPSVPNNQGGYQVDEFFNRDRNPNGGYEPIDTQPAFVDGAYNRPHARGGN
ncbi:unnamed protein product [Colias eurytheme]|nr:unnamed protein product [Colias eurytheme]